MAINKKQIKQFLEAHEFDELFNLLGWDWPERDTPYPVQLGEELFKLQPVAIKRGFIAYHCPCVPDSATRAKIETKLSRDVREHIIIFTDPETKKQRWQWVRRVPGQPLSRKEHEYLPAQPMLLIAKIGYLEVGMDEEENIDLIDVNDKVKTAFDVDKVTKKFYERFKKEHDAFLEFIDGITDMGDSQWYASVMLNRLMFIYFIQKKGFLDGDTDYLRNRLARVQEVRGKGKFHTFYRFFLMKLCHEVLAKKDRTLDKELAALIGKVPYLNGGIFQEHELEAKYGEEIDIPDEAFQAIFDFFDGYEWHLDNRPAANANEINPDVLGYIFEKYINQKQMGAYYTKEDITEYISKSTIIPCLFDKAKKSCKIAFEGETSVWNMLKEDPDRYIYPAVRHGVTFDVESDVELKTPVPYPKEIETGLDAAKPNLLERRKKWNTPAPSEAGLPTEIWRETVARRQRYEEVRGKLERGEVQSINDLITLNLDIRQFAQDVIERCESPDLLNAFWVAIAGRMPQNSNEEIKPGITVLDPTCGSGAFLFAALNILEPLYEACLERMKGFLEEWGEHPKHKNYAAFFQSIRADIGKHPSPKYFIYKSIIIHNLYGVDIMKEAVEICKLRLFLKLVAQVEDGSKIEPLPDIDFNIRAGNTLVGFATQEEMKRALQGDLLAYQTVLPEILEQAEECNGLFNLFREAQLEGDKSLTKAKVKLSGKLAELNAQLNQYLAADYGIDSAKPEKFDAFLESHQPFHWFIEFYGIIKSGGFDTIIGNPPYVEYSKVRKEYQIKGYETESCGNLYAFIMERSLRIKQSSGNSGLIVLIGSLCTARMEPLQNVYRGGGEFLYLSTYSGHTCPGILFEGVANRYAIWISRGGPSSSDSRINTTKYLKWYAAERDVLFATLFYEQSSDFEAATIPKLTHKTSKSAWEKVGSQNATLSKELFGDAGIWIYTTPIHWVKAFDFIPFFKGAGKSASTQLKQIKTSKSNAPIIGSVLNSTLFFWWWILHSDCYHLTSRELNGFPFDISSLAGQLRRQLADLNAKLMRDFNDKSTVGRRNQKTTGLVEFQVIDPKLSKVIIDEIDKVLAEHYGFTEEELDYIINYDIKYRMGKDLLEKTE